MGFALFFTSEYRSMIMMATITRLLFLGGTAAPIKRHGNKLNMCTCLQAAYLVAIPAAAAHQRQCSHEASHVSRARLQLLAHARDKANGRRKAQPPNQLSTLG
jgi:hypothetical protein